MKRVIVIVLDGLRRDMLTADLTPFLAEHAARATTFARHRSDSLSASSMARGWKLNTPSRTFLASSGVALSMSTQSWASSS